MHRSGCIQTFYKKERFFWKLSIEISQKFITAEYFVSREYFYTNTVSRDSTSVVLDFAYFQFILKLTLLFHFQLLFTEYL